MLHGRINNNSPWNTKFLCEEIWLQRMGEKGWTCPTWPSEYGGGGLSKEENKILQEEMGAIGARSPLGSLNK